MFPHSSFVTAVEMINNAREKRVSVGFCGIAMGREQREAKAVIKETG